MDDIDLQVLNVMQAQFPVCERPYRAVGEQVGLAEDEVLERVRRLREERIIRQISAIFDTKSLGYKSSLVAARVPGGEGVRGRADHQRAPGRHPQLRAEHTSTTSGTRSRCRRPATWKRPSSASTSCRAPRSTRVMYTLKLFKIGVNLDMTGTRAADAARRRSTAKRTACGRIQGALSEADIAVIREMQEDLPIERSRSPPMAERIGISQDEMFAAGRSAAERGFLAAFRGDSLPPASRFPLERDGCLGGPSEQVAEIGPQMASFAAVSHCYQRPTYPDWPYSVFTMVHGARPSSAKRSWPPSHGRRASANTARSIQRGSTKKRGSAFLPPRWPSGSRSISRCRWAARRHRRNSPNH